MSWNVLTMSLLESLQICSTAAQSEAKSSWIVPDSSSRTRSLYSMHWSRQTSGGFLWDAPKLLILMSIKSKYIVWKVSGIIFCLSDVHLCLVFKLGAMRIRNINVVKENVTKWKQNHSLQCWQGSQCCTIHGKDFLQKGFLQHLDRVETHTACSVQSLERNRLICPSGNWAPKILSTPLWSLCLRLWTLWMQDQGNQAKIKAHHQKLSGYFQAAAVCQNIWFRTNQLWRFCE